ncbi:rab3 GTPase-activating protein catalytic subunit [Harmonia axyridis]|uniref:rab3 GTPase-activating protein catalytic subunit n=1 Tax=Harmonia axyridis TaxID=115357 RepID=UPI001E275AF0|nr:rab3 GTPase-activating protein catalytic subunit [Harmonia axyridis]
MNEEIEDSEFYQQDFTTASDWEVFIARIEEIINHWKVDELKEKTKEQSIWEIKSEKFMFVDAEFELLFYKKNDPCSTSTKVSDANLDKNKIENSIDLSYTFQLDDASINRIHSCIFTWYGLTTYYVLTTTGITQMNSESKINILLSSLAVAFKNLNCDIPAFLQIREKWQGLYLGVHQNEQFRTNFSMVHLKKIPSNCQYLSNLISIFFSKLALRRFNTTVLCAAQFTYDLTDFGNNVWKQDISSMERDDLDVSFMYRLPFGVTSDPIDTLKLKVSWHNIKSDFVRDSEHSSYFQGPSTGRWSLKMEYGKLPVCLLSDCVNEFASLLGNNTSIQDILSELSLDTSVDTKVSTISSILSRAARNSLAGTQKITSAISENILVSILYYLFPDADTRQPEPSHPYIVKEESYDYRSSENVITTKGFKTCPSHSLLWRFSIIAACLLQSGGFRALAQIWYEFVQEMRYRWDRNIFIPGLARNLPDLRTCLLHQKLQMLNCCIERKKKREETQKDLEFDSAEGSSSEEEFFDCADKPAEEPKKIQPAGRLCKFKDLKLLETGEDLYIPRTQEPVPKTEDQLDEDTDVLLKLGSDAQASEMRARLMSASLLSDMESFKAANPGAILEDFVRWYSPRDWIETEDEEGNKKGELSKRMLIEDNLWAQTWKTAKPIPASKQKLQFVDTREAEKVLHFLESRELPQIIELLVPILLQMSACRLAQELAALEVHPDEEVDKVSYILKQVEMTTREGKFTARKIEAIAREMARVERFISTIRSLYHKLNHEAADREIMRQMILDLVSGKEAWVSSEVKMRLKPMFREAQERVNAAKSEDDVPEEKKSPYETSEYPNPSVREFVLTISARQPKHYSSYCPQYMRAILSNDGMRMASAFSEDINFF